MVEGSNAKVAPYLPKLTPKQYTDGQDQGQSPEQVVAALAALDARDVPAVAKALVPKTLFPSGSPLPVILGKVPATYAPESKTDQNRMFGGYSMGISLPGKDVPLGAAELIPNYKVTYVAGGENTVEGSAKPILFNDAPFNAGRARVPPSKTGASVLNSWSFNSNSEYANSVAPKTLTYLGALSSLQAA